MAHCPGFDATKLIVKQVDCTISEHCPNRLTDSATQHNTTLAYLDLFVLCGIIEGTFSVLIKCQISTMFQKKGESLDVATTCSKMYRCCSITVP